MNKTAKKSGFPDLDYIYGEEAKYYSFVSVPKELISGRYKSLSSNAQILYIKMLDRLSLSIKNRWNDEKGRTYIYYTLEAVMEALSCGHNTATKVLRELDCETGAGLIERVKQGQGKPTRIYIKSVTRLKKDALEKRVNTSKLAYNADFQDMQNEAVSKEAVSKNPEQEEKNPKNNEKSPERIENKGFSRYAKRGSQDCPKEAVKTAGKGQLINTNMNNTEFNNHHLIGEPPKLTSSDDYSIYKDDDEGKSNIPDFPIGEEYDVNNENVDVSNIKNKIGYSSLLKEYRINAEILDLFVDVIAEAKNTGEGFYIIHKQKVDVSLLKECFDSVDKESVLNVLGRLEEYQGHISNIKAYIRSALYSELQAHRSERGDAPAVVGNGYRAAAGFNLRNYKGHNTRSSQPQFLERHYTQEQHDELELKLLRLSGYDIPDTNSATKAVGGGMA